MSDFKQFFYDLAEMNCEFEHAPPSPMDQLFTIIELAHQCVTARKAFVAVNCFGSSDQITVMIMTDFVVTEYESIGTFHLAPPPEAFHACEPYFIAMNDQIKMQSVITRLQEILA